MPLVLLNRRRRGGFSPLMLFALSEPGVWYDPSDLTTLFTDTAGTIPVTTPGQAVALMLDKSKGLALGAELVVNGTFDTDTSGWTTSNSTLSVVDGKLRVTNVGATSGIGYQSFPTTIGKTYKYTVTATAETSSALPRIGTAIGGAQYGTGSLIFTATSATAIVSMRNGTAVDGAYADYDNISVRELAGFHATQATLAARPILGRVPSVGRRNILVGTATLATQTCVVTAAQHTLSFRGTGTVTLTGASTSGPLVGTGANDIVLLTFTPTAGNLTLTVSGTVNDAQLELGAVRTAYQLVGSTTFDVTEAGQPDNYYLSFDGIDDSMVTPTITPGVDKATLWAGIRKVSDTARGTVAEMSTTIASNNGALQLTAPNAGSATYGFESKGTTLTDAVASATAPITSVLTGIGDISGDRATIRVNGTQIDQDTGDQGTGNYLAYPLYIGRRAGTSQSFNGQLYGLILRFAETDAGTISQAETWLNDKTGAY